MNQIKLKFYFEPTDPTDAIQIQRYRDEFPHYFALYPNGKALKVYKGQRQYFDTWEEARAALLVVAQGRVKSILSELARAESDVSRIAGLAVPTFKPPQTYEQ